MAIKVIEYLVMGQAGTGKHTFYDSVSANVDTEWTTITTTNLTSAGEIVQYAERYNDVTEIYPQLEGGFARKSSSGDPDTYGILPGPETDFSPEVIREIPAGVIDGVNDTFVISHQAINGTEQVFLNGVLQNAGATNDYTLGSDNVTITFVSAVPQISDVLLVSYRKVQ